MLRLVRADRAKTLPTNHADMLMAFIANVIADKLCDAGELSPYRKARHR